MQTGQTKKFSEGLAGALEKAHTPPTRGSTVSPSPLVTLVGRPATETVVVAPTPAPAKAVVIMPKPPVPAKAPAAKESGARMAAQLRELAAKMQAGTLDNQALAAKLKAMLDQLAPETEGEDQGG